MELHPFDIQDYLTTKHEIVAYAQACAEIAAEMTDKVAAGKYTLGVLNDLIVAVNRLPETPHAAPEQPPAG